MQGAVQGSAPSLPWHLGKVLFRRPSISKKSQAKPLPIPAACHPASFFLHNVTVCTKCSGITRGTAKL